MATELNPKSKEQTTDQIVFSGGLSVALVGGIMGTLYTAGSWLWNIISTRSVVSMSLINTEEAFDVSTSFFLSLFLFLCLIFFFKKLSLCISFFIVDTELACTPRICNFFKKCDY